MDASAPAENTDINANLASIIWPDSTLPTSLQSLIVSRSLAMQVPALARARNVIAGTIAELPLRMQRSNGERIEPSLPWVDQPERSSARAVTLAWTVDDLSFYGASYWQVTDVYSEGGRPARFVRVNPTRVSADTDGTGTVVTRWKVDGKPLPLSGPGSLVVFAGLEEGVLARGGRTIRTALELEKAAYRYASEPVPHAVLKNTGTDLPADKVEALLSAWRTARSSNSTAYLNSAVDLDLVGFDAEQLQLVEARKYLAVEIARLMNVPAHFVNASDGDSMTYSNLTQERRSLVDFSLRHYLAAIEQRLSMDDITPQGTSVRFDLSEFLRADAMERAQVYALLIESGVIDTDEAREREDLTPRGRTT